MVSSQLSRATGGLVQAFHKPLELWMDGLPQLLESQLFPIAYSGTEFIKAMRGLDMLDIFSHRGLRKILPKKKKNIRQGWKGTGKVAGPYAGFFES